MFDFYVTYNEP